MTAFELAVQQIGAPVIGLLLTLILGWIVREIVLLSPLVADWISSHAELLKSKLSVQQLAIIETIVTKAVQAAEQSSAVGLILKDGVSKKNFALNFIQAELDKLDIPFDVTSAASQIEAALNQGVQNKNFLSSFGIGKLADSDETPAPVEPVLEQPTIEQLTTPVEVKVIPPATVTVEAPVPVINAQSAIGGATY